MQLDCIKLDRPEVLPFMFPGYRTDSPPPANVTDYAISVDDDVTLGARFYPSGSQEGPLILFFHGNGEVAADYDDFAPGFTELGINFLVVDYRGYGKSTGSPSASALLQDSHIALEWTKNLKKENEYTGPLIIMGRSLGSAAAIELASQQDSDIAGLVIESGFAYTMPVLQVLGVNTDALGLVEEDGFRNDEKMFEVNIPTYILHAQFDEIISVSSAETLMANCAARGRKFNVIPGAGHNNIIQKVGMMYFQEIAAFINKIGGPRRKRRPGIRG